MYTLSIRESKKAKHEGCTCQSERTFSEYSTISYYRDEGDKRKIWPEPPNPGDQKSIYKRIFMAKEKSPYCIYAFVHQSFVRASSLSDLDRDKFKYQYVHNKDIFTDYDGKIRIKKENIDRLKKQLRLGYAVPEWYVVDQFDSFQCEVSDIVSEDGTTAEEKLKDLEKLVKAFAAGFMKGGALIVDEERQLNNWLNKLLNQIIIHHSFRVIHHFSENRYSIFGSSQPNLTFIKIHEGAFVGAAIHTVQLDNEIEQSVEQCNEIEQSMEQCNVVGTIEYKKTHDNIEKNAPQCFANMIRVANDRVIELLKGGTLVNSFTVYGLLVSHSNYEECIPMKYYSDFESEPVIQMGYPANFAELLFCILQC